MLKIRGLTKTYKSQQVVDQLNLTLRPAEIYCLLGKNGAGKTTTLNILLGFTAPSSGTISFHDRPMQPGSKEMARKIAYVPESVILHPHLTAMENLDFFLQMSNSKLSKQELTNLLQLCGLEHPTHKKRLGQYSKGMRQKVALAIAAGRNAEILLLDEPTSGLDPRAMIELTNLLHRLTKEGKSVLITTHDIHHALATGDRIGIMHEGKIVYEVDTDKIQAEELLKTYLAFQ